MPDQTLMLPGLLGALIGAVLGLTGAGGGVLAVPALILGLGMALPQAVPVSLIAVALAATLGAVGGLRKGIVRYRVALLMAALGISSAPAGLWLAHRLPETLLTPLFCALMLLIAARMLRRTTSLAPCGASDVAEPGKRCVLDPATGRFRWTSPCTFTLALIGCSAGLFTGMLGVGGGFLIVPAFRTFTPLSMQAASATSLAVIALVSATTVTSTLLHGYTLNATGATFIAATTAGLLLARRLARRIPEIWLQRTLGSVILLVALGWLARQFL